MAPIRTSPRKKLIRKKKVTVRSISPRRRVSSPAKRQLATRRSRGGAPQYNDIENSFPSLSPQVWNTVTGTVNATPHTTQRIRLVNTDFERKRLYIARSDDFQISMLGVGVGGSGVHALIMMDPDIRKIHQHLLSIQPNVEGFVFLQLTDLREVHAFLQQVQLQINRNNIMSSVGPINQLKEKLRALIDEAVSYD